MERIQTLTTAEQAFQLYSSQDFKGSLAYFTFLKNLF